MNKVILMGRLTRDPELRYTQSTNIAQATFSVACDRRRAADGTQKADFINCVAWRQTAEFVSKYFAKGNRILLTGSIQTRDYTDKDGRKVYVTEVIVDDVEFCESKGQSQGAGSYSSAVPAGDTAASADAPQDGNGYFALDSNEFVPF